MPLYEIGANRELIPFRRLQGAELYEREIEDLFWASPDEFMGEALFLVARQPTLPLGGRLDIVALDRDARVIVVEIKRDVDRGQLAQCLEYAGWARTTSLDEVSSLYQRGGQGRFFSDWQEFTGSSSLAVINRSPRLVLVAHDFHGRTGSALDFLMEGGVALEVLKVAIYEDEQGRRFVDVEGEREPELGTSARDVAQEATDHTRVEGRRVRLADLVEANILRDGDELVWERPRIGVTYNARVVYPGTIELDDGRRFASPSRAAVEAAGIPAYDGWLAWKRADGAALDDLRLELARRRGREDQRTGEPDLIT